MRTLSPSGHDGLGLLSYGDQHRIGGGAGADDHVGGVTAANGMVGELVFVVDPAPPISAADHVQVHPNGTHHPAGPVATALRLGTADSVSGDEGTRTLNPRLAKAVRYQLRHVPDEK